MRSKHTPIIIKEKPDFSKSQVKKRKTLHAKSNPNHPNSRIQFRHQNDPKEVPESRNIRKTHSEKRTNPKKK